MLLSTLEDLDYTDYTDDIALLSHAHKHIDIFRGKRIGLNSFGQQAGLAINCDKSRVMYIGNKVLEPERVGEHN